MGPVDPGPGVPSRGVQVRVKIHGSALEYTSAHPRFSRTARGGHRPARGVWWVRGTPPRACDGRRTTTTTVTGHRTRLGSLVAVDMRHDAGRGLAEAADAWSAARCAERRPPRTPPGRRGRLRSPPQRPAPAGGSLGALEPARDRHRRVGGKLIVSKDRHAAGRVSRWLLAAGEKGAAVVVSVGVAGPPERPTDCATLAAGDVRTVRADAGPLRGGRARGKGRGTPSCHRLLASSTGHRGRTAARAAYLDAAESLPHRSVAMAGSSTTSG